VPALARLADMALKPDAFHAFQERYGGQTMYDDTVGKLTNSLRDGRGWYSLFKAVLVPGSVSEDRETIVGFSQWRVGYVETPKTDPFAIKRDVDKSATFEAEVPNVTVGESKERGEAAGIGTETGDSTTGKPTRPEPFYSNPYEEVSRKLGNSYIGTIRGKKHLYLHRLIVHPSYQRQGIGQELLNWGVEIADRENLVSWLFSRPAGSRLYEKNGWKAIQTTEVEISDDDLQVAPIVSMLRLPRGRGG